MFQNALVRTPAPALISGLTTSFELGTPNYELALVQHQNYINALMQCAVEVTTLSPLEEYPDACFVEDVAVLTENIALITRPGAATRQDEVKVIEPILKTFFKKNIFKINAPGSLDGGDVLKVDNHFFIGLSARTNEEGAQQMIQVVTQYGYTASVIPLKNFLHLKTGVSYLDHGYLLVSGELINHPAFVQLKQIIVDPYESYAANCILVNGTVLLPSGHSKTKKAISELGFPIIEVDVSEFRKLDGGLSCLSLRF